MEDRVKRRRECEKRKETEGKNEKKEEQAGRKVGVSCAKSQVEEMGQDSSSHDVGPLEHQEEGTRRESALKTL